MDHDDLDRALGQCGLLEEEVDALTRRVMALEVELRRPLEAALDNAVNAVTRREIEAALRMLGKEGS